MTEQRPERASSASRLAGFDGRPFTEFKPREPSAPLRWGIMMLGIAGVLLTLGGVGSATDYLETQRLTWNGYLAFGAFLAIAGAALAASGAAKHALNVEFLVSAEIDRRRAAETEPG